MSALRLPSCSIIYQLYIYIYIHVQASWQADRSISWKGPAPFIEILYSPSSSLLIEVRDWYLYRIFIYMYVYIYISVYVFIYKYVYICISMCICTRIFVCICIFIIELMYFPSSSLLIEVTNWGHELICTSYIDIYIYICICIYVYICICISMYLCTRIYLCIYIIEMMYFLSSSLRIVVTNRYLYCIDPPEMLSRFRKEDLDICGLCWYSKPITQWYKLFHSAMLKTKLVRIYCWFDSTLFSHLSTWDSL